MMGPNALWLAESLSQVFEFQPGIRVLDLGCGRALSSIFLAKEFGVQVWAADLWIKPTENLSRIEDAGVADRVFPIFVEAHQGCRMESRSGPGQGRMAADVMIVVRASGTARTHSCRRSGPRCHQAGGSAFDIVSSLCSLRPTVKRRILPRASRPVTRMVKVY